MIFPVAPPQIRHTADWRAILTLDAYRFLVAFGLVTVLITGIGPAAFEPVLPRLFRAACLIYLAQCVLAMAAALARRPGLSLHVVLVVAVDLVFFTLLSLASAGVASGLGMLLIAPLAAAGMLLQGRLAAALAAAAVIGMLGQETWRWLQWPDGHSQFAQAGILGSLYFIAVAISHWLAQRAHDSEALAADRASEARDLAELNRHIIQQMRIGAVVVDPGQKISLINDAALGLLDLRDVACHNRRLVEVAPVLAEALNRWLTQLDNGRTIIRIGGRTLFPMFSALEHAADAPVLIFLEDAMRQNEQAQQIKLMSIGRLTASIAHEIRNPLGAISHAGQLLAESPTLGLEEKQLLEIVHRHSRRIDAIVTDVMGLSRRSDSSRESLALATWLRESVADYRQTNDDAPCFVVEGVDEDLHVEFDPGQLRQVLFNLWDNARRYARRSDRPLELRLTGGRQRCGNPVLDIADNGPGINADIAEQILEPFFTTARDGTGLGLYIARELCEANGAELMPVARSAGACFRITFAHRPDRPSAGDSFPADERP